MPFKRILQTLVEATPGATGAVLADWEGEAVDQVGLTPAGVIAQIWAARLLHVESASLDAISTSP